METEVSGGLHAAAWWDLAALEKTFVSAGVASADQLERHAEGEGGLGLFIRSLVGVDCAAAKKAFSRFLNSRTHTANQLDFVNLVIDPATQLFPVTHVSMIL